MATIASQSAMATTTTASTSTLTLTPLSKTTTISSIPVRAIPVPNTNKLILAGPCIVLRTATVAEQMQALRQEKKVITKPAEPQSPELLRCKRRSDISKLGFPEAKPASVSRRNARERNRVKLVNQGFETLREHVPNGKKNRKMSKVETLRSAVEYIRQMQRLLEEHDGQIGKIKVDISDNDSMADINIDSDDCASVIDCDVGVTSELDVAATSTPTEIQEDIMQMESADNSNNNNNNNKFVNFNNNNTDVNNLNMNEVNTLNVNALTNLNGLNMNSLNVNSLSVLSPKEAAVSGSQSFTVLTVPVQQAMSQTSPDDVFLPDPFVHQGQLLTTPATNGLSTMTTMTTLRGMGSLSGGPGITFTELQPLQQQRQRLTALSENTNGLVLMEDQQQNQQNAVQHDSQQVNVLNSQQPSLQESQQQMMQQQQQHSIQQQETVTSSLSDTSTTFTDLTIPDNHHHHHQQTFTPLILRRQLQLNQNHQHFTQQTSSLTEPVSNGSLSLADTCPRNQLQTMTMTQPQLSVDQVPSPSLSTASSHTSDSSYESYESMDSLEEELQDLSKWITELCNSNNVQDIQTHGEGEETPDFLA